jgi:hypothetical protein
LPFWQLPAAQACAQWLAVVAVIVMLLEQCCSPSSLSWQGQELLKMKAMLYASMWLGAGFVLSKDVGSLTNNCFSGVSVAPQKQGQEL